MWGGNVKEKLSEVFELLQGLDVKSTETNVTTLSYVLRTLRELYNELPEEAEVKDE